MPRQRNRSVAGTITAAFDKVITDYPLLVLHSAFILGVMLGQQTARTRFSFMDWAKAALPESPRAMTAALPSFARRSSAARRRPGRRKASRRQIAAQAGRASGRSRRAKAAAAAAE
jgi:hypothetical protein